jgi:hypothetical protein
MTGMNQFDQDLRGRIFDFLGGALTLQELVAWFSGASWDSRTELAADLDFLLAEREAISEEEFHERLRVAASTVEITTVVASVTTATSDETQYLGLRSLGTQTIRKAFEFADT